MTQRPVISDELKARHDHAVWLEDYEHWHREHRETLAMLVHVQEIILEREEQIERQTAEIKSHELELQDFDLIGIDLGSPDPEKQSVLNARFAHKHQQVREHYELTKRRHVSIVDEVRKLLQMCQSAN